MVSSTCLLGRLEHRVHAPDDAHRQDHVRVLAALEEVAQDVVGDAPDEGDDLVVGGLVHSDFPLVALVAVDQPIAWARMSQQGPNRPRMSPLESG